MLNEVKRLTDVDISDENWWKNKNSFPIQMFRPDHSGAINPPIVTVDKINRSNWAIESDGSSHGHICSYKIFDFEAIKSKFLNGDQIAFGSDDQGICSMASLFDTKEEFYAAYCEKIEDSIEIEDFIPMYIYYSPSLVNKECDGITNLGREVEKYNGKIGADYIFIGLFWGTEY